MDLCGLFFSISLIIFTVQFEFLLLLGIVLMFSQISLVAPES